MAASDNLSPEQFAMVPTKTVGSWLSGDSKGEVGRARQLNGTRRKSPNYPAIRDDIAKNGIKEPLFASSMFRSGPTLDDGHHRLAAAYELGLTHVPVTTWALNEHEWKS